MDSNWFKELFIDEAKAALNANSSVSDEQVADAVTDYLEENPVQSATATIENDVLVIK